jgi:hypothetical protein
MSTDPDYHRTFLRLQMIPEWGGYCWVNAAGLPYRRAKQNQNEGFKAFQAVGGDLINIADLNNFYIQPRDDQNFWHYATAWEKTFSTLCGSSSSREAIPVVDERLTVIGHCGRFHGSRIFIRKGAGRLGGDPVTGISHEFKPGEPVFVRASSPSPSYVSLRSVGRSGYEVYVTLDGAVRYIAGGAVIEGAESTISPLDFMSFGRLGQMVGHTVGRVVFPSVRGCRLKSIEFKERQRLQAEGSAEALAQQAAREAERAAAGTSRPTLRGVGAVGPGGAGQGATNTARRVGSMSPEQMEQYLASVLAARPDLRRLMAARVMTGQGRMDAIKGALKEFEQTQGWKVVEKSAREMEAVTTRGNIVHMRNETRELWINRDRAARWDPDEFYEQTVHDLSAHALAGRGGSLGPSDLPFIGREMSKASNGLWILEQSIKQGGTNWITNVYGP